MNWQFLTQASRSKALLWFVALGLTVLLVVLALVRARTPEPLDVAASRVLDCVERFDSRCMYAYIDEAEILRLGLTQAKFERFIDQIVAPNLRGFEVHGETQYNSYELTGMLTAVRTYTLEDGRKLELAITVASTDGQPKAVVLVGTLFLSACGAMRKQNDAPLAGVEKLRHWADCGEKLLPTLNATGIPGFVRTSKTADLYEFLTWESWIALCRDKLRAAEANQYE